MTLDKHLNIDHSYLYGSIQELKESALALIEATNEETRAVKYIKNVLKIMDAYMQILLTPDSYDDKYIERVAHLSMIHINILHQFINIEDALNHAIK